MELTVDQTFDTVVVGAGVVGGAVAYYLSKQGQRVCLMDRESVGSGASAHGHGVLSIVGKDFIRGDHFDLGLAGKNMFPEFAAQVADDSGIDPMFHEKQGVSLALIEEEREIYTDALAWQQESVSMQWLDSNQLHELEPRITPEALGGVLYSHGQVDAYRLSLALAQAVERMGGTVLLREATGLISHGYQITGVSYPGGSISSGSVVIAMGAWSNAAREWLQFPIPVKPLHGQVLQLRQQGDPVKIFITTGRHGPIFPRKDGVLLVGSVGGVSMTGADVDTAHVFDPTETGPWEYDLNPSEWGRNFMLEQVLKIMPSLESAEVLAHLAGVRPLCADRMPLIGAVPGWEGVFLATGHGTKGIHLSGITGRILSDIMLSGKTAAFNHPEAFSPARFICSI